MSVLISHGVSGIPTSRPTLSGVAGRGQECYSERFRVALRLDLFENYSGFLLLSAR